MKLSAGTWVLALAPQPGGAITSLRRSDQDVLRPAAEGAIEPFHLTSFTMMPYVNRIAPERFRGGRLAPCARSQS